MTSDKLSAPVKPQADQPRLGDRVFLHGELNRAGIVVARRFFPLLLDIDLDVGGRIRNWPATGVVVDAS